MKNLLSDETVKAIQKDLQKVAENLLTNYWFELIVDGVKFETYDTYYDFEDEKIILKASTEENLPSMAHRPMEIPF